jgi:type II secretory pathway component PulF
MKEHFPTFVSLPRKIAEAFGFVSARARLFDPLVLMRELASMLRAEIPLPQALAIVAEGQTPRVQARLGEVRERVESGESLSSALEALPSRWVPAVLRAAVAAGERSGRLPELLDEVAGELERLSLLDRRLRGIMVYPVCVLLLTVLVFHIVLWKVIPVYATLYEGLGATLPWLLQLVVKAWRVIDFLSPLIILLVAAYLVYALVRPRGLGPSTPIGRFLARHTPVLRDLRRSLLEVRFARTLRSLLDAGLPLPQALDLCEPVVADDRAGSEIVAACRRIRDGAPPSEALHELRFLSPAFLWFLRDTERRGDFIDVTAAMADAAEQRFIARVEVVSRVAEPVSVVALGVMVGAVVISIYQTIFGIIPLVQ